MTASTNDDRNIIFYNSMAENYDSMDALFSSHNQVREKVKEKFLKSMNGDIVLDFGGGTGRDLEWLITNGFKVYFCEPSEKMKAKAIQLNHERIKSNRIVFFVNAQTDFHNWKKNIPIPERVDGILANFAVLNNIRDIQEMFRALAMIVNPRGIMIANILNPHPFKLYKSDLLKKCFCLLTGKTFTKKISQEGIEQIVYFHSLSALRKAALPFFNVITINDLGGFGFLCVEFSRSEF